MGEVLEKMEDEEITGAKKLVQLPLKEIEGEMFRGGIRIRGDYRDKIRDVLRRAPEGANAFRATPIGVENHMIRYYELPREALKEIRKGRRTPGDVEVKTGLREGLTLEEFERRFGIRSNLPSTDPRSVHYDGI